VVFLAEKYGRADLSFAETGGYELGGLSRGVLYVSGGKYRVKRTAGMTHIPEELSGGREGDILGGTMVGGTRNRTISLHHPSWGRWQCLRRAASLIFGERRVGRGGGARSRTVVRSFGPGSDLVWTPIIMGLIMESGSVRRGSPSGHHEMAGVSDSLKLKIS
jgi:hypothetical protein